MPLASIKHYIDQQKFNDYFKASPSSVDQVLEFFFFLKVDQVPDVTYTAIHRTLQSLCLHRTSIAMCLRMLTFKINYIIGLVEKEGAKTVQST